MTILASEAKTMLEERLIPFWLGLRDDEHGGWYDSLDFDLCLHQDAEKGCIFHSRVLWFFARCARQLDRDDCRAAADHAYQFLMDHCLDREYGGVYWSLHADGTPLDTTKHTYNQAFAIYALSEYARLTADQTALETALGLFRLIEERCRDAGGYLEAFDRTFQPVSNEKLSENGVLAQRTMNTLLHVFEGYAGLYETSHNPDVKAAMMDILTIWKTKIFDPILNRQRVFFDREYRSLIDLHSYGHDIETSWLLDWGASLLGEPALAKEIADLNQHLAHRILERAYQDGSLSNECENGIDDPTRIWWVQAEAILGFLNAGEKEPETPAFRTAAEQIWQYIQSKLVDHRPGSEWYWAVDETGTPLRKPIVEPWKGPYHNGRLCLEILRRGF